MPSGKSRQSGQPGNQDNQGNKCHQDNQGISGNQCNLGNQDNQGNQGNQGNSDNLNYHKYKLSVNSDLLSLSDDLVSSNIHSFDSPQKPNVFLLHRSVNKRCILQFVCKS